MATVPEIIEDLGGATAIASQIAVPLTTVHSWKRVGYVPSWRVPALVDLAERLGKPIVAGDFPSSRPVAEQAA